MKSITVFCALILSIAFSFKATAQVATEETAAIGIARGAAAQCLNDYRSNNWIINVSAMASTICDYINQPPKMGYRVIFSAKPADCGGHPCDPIVIAEVEISCNKQVVSSSCY